MNQDLPRPRPPTNPEPTLVEGIPVEMLTRRDRAALGYEVDLNHEEVAEFESAVTMKMIRVGYEKITRPELYLKVREALAAYKKEQAVRAALTAFHKVNPTAPQARQAPTARQNSTEGST